MKKILSWEEARTLSNSSRSQGGIVVTTNGCFDLLHKGHVQYLEYARSLGEILIVALNADASVKKLKGPTRPINTAADRAYVVAALSCVDGVCIFEEETPSAWLETIRPSVHVKGADWQGKKIPEEELLKNWGGRVHYAKYLDGYSTTNLIEKSKGSPA
ncbi:MAG: D-glycero-beta-D-manno-heptose 1-phosphate adenylyltransferase [Bdellovibrionota bacterium]